MALQSEELTILKRYLLGEVTPEERETLEQRLLTDDDYFEEFRLAKEDLIDRYAEGEMTPDEREKFQKHFLITKERRESLKLAESLIAYSSSQAREKGKKKESNWQPLVWASSLFSTPMRTAASVAVAIAITIVAFTFYRRQPSDTARGLVALNAAYRVERPIEARVSDFQHAPFADKRSGEPVQFDANSRRLAEVMLQSGAENNPSSTSYHALGKLDLFEERFDDAIRHLEQALASDPNNAKIHTDLGAAWLEQGNLQIRKGEQSKGSESFANSLKHLNRALEIEPSLLEALFNRALVRTHFKLFKLAEEDWKLYLTRDATSPWADEAKIKLKLVEQFTQQALDSDDESRFQRFLTAQRAADDDTAWRLLSRNREFTGSAIENRLIDEHLAAVLRGETTKASDRLQSLSYVGDLTVRRAGDRFISDLAKFYSTTTHQRPIAEARQLMRSGHEKLRSDKTVEALDFYKAAARIFEQNGDTCGALYVKYPSAQARLLQGESRQSLEDFEEVRTISAANHYRWLEGQSLNALANVHIGLNNFSIALELSQQSLKILKEIQDSVGVAKVNDQLGVESLRVGNPRQALEFHHHALNLVNEESLGPLPLWRSYYTTAVPFHALRLDDAAIDFTQEALRLAPDTKSPVNVSHSYAQLGVMYGDLGNYERAIESINQAFDIGKTVTTEKVRLRALAYASLQLGNLYRLSREFKRAIDSYDEAIRLYNQLAFGAFSYVAHKGKFLACVAEGVACSSVEEELNIALRLYEEHRWKILETRNRYSFFDNEQGVYDVAIDYEFTRKGDKEKAFDYSEKSRARTLLDLAETGDLRNDHESRADLRRATPVQELKEIQNQLTENAQIVQYSVLTDKLLIWFISKTRFEGFQHAVSSKALEEKVSSYLGMIANRSESDDDRQQRLAVELYDLLIKPIAHLLETDKLICIVPDKVLNRLPYTTLISSTDGTYLIEHYDSVLSPSSTMFIRRSKTATERVLTRPEKALIVGDPQFDSKVYSSFKYLPAAYVEARQIAPFYSLPPEVLTRSEATEMRVVEGMEKADVIHLATHAVVDEQSPMYSKLLLAKSTGEASVDAGNDGVLFSNEIYNLRLKARLVVLPACRTGFERYYGGEGMVGIWSPFISRNVPLVVASLWAVDSDSTKELMINFHKLRTLDQVPSAAALRKAQLSMLHGPNKTYRQPYHWAAYIAIGGYTSF